MIKVTSPGDFKKTLTFISKARATVSGQDLAAYGQRGVSALRANTPIDTGETARSWEYRIVRKSRGFSIVWYNTHIVDNVPIAVIIQYGHGTRNGGYVLGRDYINPAIRPVFDNISNELWRRVTRG
jgi:hypothetical protein